MLVDESLHLGVRFSMAAMINIPPSEIPILARLVDLEQEEFEQLIQAMRETTPSATRAKYVSGVQKRLPGIPPEDTAAILSTVFSVVSLPVTADMPPPEIAELIVNTAASKQYGSQFEGARKDRLKERLLRLVSLDSSFALMRKSVDAVCDASNVFCDCEIRSDVRALFDETEERAEGAVVVHHLKIGFHHAGRHDEFFVMLADEELEEIKTAVVQAQKKAAVLRNVITKADVQLL